MNRAVISNLLRSIGLLYYTDRLRYFIQKAKNYNANQQFLKQNPGIKLPPDYLIYESFQMSYEKYFTHSKETAIWLCDYFKKYISIESAYILDWGCGPGRIIRHLNTIAPNAKLYGTDYNEASVKWCSKNLKEISFNLNTLEAKLPYENNYFDVIYGISIFTHLSENMHYSWYNELYRVLKPGGILFLTTQGNNFLEKLSSEEQELYKQGLLVVRGKVKEGHRTFSAFHPDAFMNKLFSNANILEHNRREDAKGKFPAQDIWVVRK